MASPETSKVEKLNQMVDLYFSKQCCSCGKLNTQKGEQNSNQIWNQLQSIPTQNPEISNQITSQSFFFLSFRRKREREREGQPKHTTGREASKWDERGSEARPLLMRWRRRRELELWACLSEIILGSSWKAWIDPKDLTFFLGRNGPKIWLRF